MRDDERQSDIVVDRPLEQELVVLEHHADAAPERGDMA
jgi:hypothetical protein